MLTNSVVVQWKDQRQIDEKVTKSEAMFRRHSKWKSIDRQTFFMSKCAQTDLRRQWKEKKTILPQTKQPNRPRLFSFRFFAMNSIYKSDVDICGNAKYFKQTLIWSAIQVTTPKHFSETKTGSCPSYFVFFFIARLVLSATRKFPYFDNLLCLSNCRFRSFSRFVFGLHELRQWWAQFVVCSLNARKLENFPSKMMWERARRGVSTFAVIYDHFSSRMKMLLLLPQTIEKKSNMFLAFCLSSFVQNEIPPVNGIFRFNRHSIETLLIAMRWTFFFFRFFYRLAIFLIALVSLAAWIA